jgi:ABC-type transport system involved in multi-copper enzyme maturation permease subunit
MVIPAQGRDDKLENMLHVFRHELRLIFREPRFWIPFIIPPVILAASQAIAVSRYGGQIMQGMEGYMMLLLGCLMAPMGAPLAGDSFAGERERNSLELLQLSPIAPAKLFWGKLFAILPFPVLFAVLAQAAYWFAHPEIPSAVAIASILGAISAVLLTTSFSLILSLRVKTVRSATQLTLFLIVPLLFLVQFGYEVFLDGLVIPVVTLFVSAALSAFAAVLGLRKFASL